MLNNLRKPFHLPPAHHWDSMFDSMMGKLELFPGEELHSELDEYIQPDMEISEQAVTLRIALPGFFKDEISLEIENESLHVRAEHKATAASHKGKKLLRGERIHAEINHSLRLPGDIVSAKANAVYKDGVLIVSVPRAGSNSCHIRKIEVK